MAFAAPGAVKSSGSEQGLRVQQLNPHPGSTDGKPRIVLITSCASVSLLDKLMDRMVVRIKRVNMYKQQNSIFVL